MTHAKEIDYSATAQASWWTKTIEEQKKHHLDSIESNNVCRHFSPIFVSGNPSETTENRGDNVELDVAKGVFKYNEEVGYAPTLIPTGKSPVNIKIKYNENEEAHIAAGNLINFHLHTYREHLDKSGQQPENHSEMHFVFSVEHGEREMKVALGIMLVASEDVNKNPELQKIIEAMRERSNKADLNLKNFLPKNYEASGYYGSLTTPTGDFGVTHLVPSESSYIKISKSQLEEIRELHEPNAAIPHKESPATYRVGVHVR